MSKTKIECTYRISNNFYEFYLLKWGVKNRARLCLNTSPDPFSMELDRSFLMNDKSLFKILFSMMRRSLLEYSKDSDRFTVYSNDRKSKIQFDRNVAAVETAEKAINLCEDIQDYDKDFFLVEINGAKFFVRKSVFSDIYIIKEAFLFEQYSFIYPFLKYGVVLDIGANIGDTAILFCTKGADKIYAYEPHPIFFNLAIRNIELNGMSNNIKVYPYGVGDKNEVIKIKDDSMLGPTGSFGSKEIMHAMENEINIIPFSRIIEEIGAIDVVKMDCEGAEFGAILSCPQHLLRKIKVMAIEFHDNPVTIIDYLSKNGFCVEIKKNTPSKYGRRGLLFAKRI